MSDRTPLPGGNGSHEYQLVVEFEDPDGPPIGLIEWHTRRDGEPCGGAVYWRASANGAIAPRHQLVSLDPLTVTPSLACPNCGSHGFITDGRWVDA